MQVDPIIKGDLHLIKEAFEAGSLNQSGAATYVPLRPMISSARQVHENIRVAVARYPSVYVKNSADKSSLIDRVQEECLPCSARLKGLKQLDISLDLDLMLGAYNTSTLKNLGEFFKNMKGQTPIERNICEAFAALRSNCVPDLRRLKAAMTLTLSEIRGFDLKALKDAFLTVALGLLAKLSISYTTGFDKYTRLITDSLRCMANDLKNQIAKLDPILSAGGRANSIQAFRAAWSKNEADKNWLHRDVNFQPVFNTKAFEAIDKATRVSTEAIDKVQNATADFKATLDGAPGQVGEALNTIEGIMNLCIGRVEANLDGALQDLLKLLKVNEQNMNSMNTILQQVQTIIGTIALVEALISSDARKQYDPCGPKRARRFFSELTIPDRQIYIVQPPADSGRPADDVDVIITTDPIQVDNPIVRDILQQAGVATRKINVGASAAPGAQPTDEKNIGFVVDVEPVNVNFFSCMRKSLTLGQ